MSLAPRELAQPRSDGATSAAARDPSAFGRLYTEHFDGLYDFVARIVHDRDLAGEIVQSTFTKAWGELRAGRELTQPKAWLYAVARNHALDEVRRRRRLADEPFIYAQPDPSRLADPQAVAEDSEIVELVWSSAAALNPDEYSLLDLHVRHGFGAADLADALDLERGAVYTRLSRLRSSLEESVAATLLVRRGQDACPELAAIVAEHDAGDAITPQLRRAVRAHVKDCDVCCEARRRAMSPVSLFGALVPVVPLAGMHEGILAAIVPGGAAHAAAVAGGGSAATTARQGSKAKYLAGASGGLAAAVAVVAIALTPGPAVRDPSRAFSVDHVAGVASADRTVSMRWSPGKNAKGYSVIFSRDKTVEPPARENVSGTQYTSPALTPGSWWFILRSHGRDGSWTHTLRVGPFMITAAVARVTPRIAKAPTPRAKHHRATSRRHAQPSAPATKPSTAADELVAGVRAAPTAPRESPAKKKPRKKKSPPRAVAPPPAAPPPASAAPSPPAAEPVTQSPPASSPAPVAEPDDDEHDDHGDDDAEQHTGRGDGDHGHGDSGSQK